jgi:hypothetical protein
MSNGVLKEYLRDVTSNSKFENTNPVINRFSVYCTVAERHVLLEGREYGSSRYMGGCFPDEESRRDPGFLATREAIHFHGAGLYDEIVSGPPLGGGLHYVEFLEPDPDLSDEAMAEHFRTRTEKHATGKLDYVFRRIGMLGPAPGDLAV